MGNLKIYCGVGVSSTFPAVMRCSYQFFAVLRYSEPPNAPLIIMHKFTCTLDVCVFFFLVFFFGFCFKRHNFFFEKEQTNVYSNVIGFLGLQLVLWFFFLKPPEFLFPFYSTKVFVLPTRLVSLLVLAVYLPSHSDLDEFTFFVMRLQEKHFEDVDTFLAS